MACNLIRAQFHGDRGETLCWERRNLSDYYLDGSPLINGTAVYQGPNCNQTQVADEGYYSYDDANGVRNWFYAETDNITGKTIILRTGVCSDCAIAQVSNPFTTITYFDCCGAFQTLNPTIEGEIFYLNPNRPYTGNFQVIAGTNTICSSPTPTPTFVPSPPIICFNLTTEGLGNWSCSITPSSTYNGKASYILLQPDCTTPFAYVFWVTIRGRWEVAPSLGNGNYFAHNFNPVFPITTVTYPWIVDNPKFISSINSTEGSCNTPSVTPTTTPTPTSTITPSITPSNSPVVSTQNECVSRVIFPMGLSCRVLSQPTTPFSNNGSLEVQITGGTPPYSIFWENGNRNAILTNLRGGNYSVKVVDYYGDFTATTTCSLTQPEPQCNLEASLFLATPTATPAPSLTQTSTPTPTPTPTNIPETMTLKASSVNSITFSSLSSQTNSFLINWNGTSLNTYGPGNHAPTFTYGSPYTGDITIGSLNLTSIKVFNLVTTNPSASSPYYPITLNTNELTKLDGLVTHYTGPNIVLSGRASELPRTLNSLFTLSNRLSGSTFDLPSGMTGTLEIYGTNSISGDTLGLPRNLTSLTIQNNNTISGNTSGLPTGLTSFYISGLNTISGTTAGLPRNLSTFYLGGNSTLIGGGTPDLPTGLTYCVILGLNTVSGSTSGLPTGLTTVQITGFNTLSGDTSGLPRNLTYLYITGDNKIGGDVANLPSGLTEMYLLGSGTTSGEIISGNTLNLPRGLTSVSIFGENIITGDAADLPSGATFVAIGGNNTISGYTSPHTWPTPMNQLTLFGSVSNNSTFIDNILIDLTASTWTGTKIINLKGVSSATATAAVTYLLSQGVSVSVTP